MNCKEVKYCFPDLLDRSIASELKDEVNAHLAVCETCRREADELQQVFLMCKDVTPSAPSSYYWGTILPRIHERIEAQPTKALPEWISRLVLPLTAVTVFVLFIITNYPVHISSDAQELQAILYQFQPEELQQLDQNESLNGVLESSNTSMEKSDIAETDKEILKQLLKEEDHSGLYSDVDYDVSSVTIDERDTDQLVSILEQQSLTN